MIINNAPVNEAIVSNVAEIGEFRIRNSAKAFSILSSGLYANKIRAIIRELSCNAVDSHAAAGKKDTPFDVHLPTQMEPWFSIRDYGTGLSHEQVTQIYTTYFESTKTASNEFIGALGLGSKSPFSYTDNFTVTAVKDGVKGIYSAFINEQGVPSIALMTTDESADPSGVEVQFAVNDQWDFGKFREEAQNVYRYFTLRPVITNMSNFEIHETEYETRDIIPGVHQTKSHRGSRAIMGNIAYPIDVPNAEKNLGELTNLLQHSLEMHFDIGELDFQASREGLSYIPQTIDAIKRKLEAVNAQLAVHVAAEADAIANLWERCDFLCKKGGSYMWSAAVQKYIADTKNPMFAQPIHRGYIRPESMMLRVDDLSKRFNINLRGFSKHHYYETTNNINTTTVKSKKPNADGTPGYDAAWEIHPTLNVRFVVNDTKVGATERAKYHVKANATGVRESRTYYVLEPADKNKPMNTKAFFRALRNPPADQIIQASTLDEKPRKDTTGGGTGIAKNVTIMRLEERGQGGYYRSQDYVWREAGKMDSYDNSTTYYYIPLSGFTIDCERINKNFSSRELANTLSECGVPALNNITIYGVRKGDIEAVKARPNWVELDTHIMNSLVALTPEEVKSIAMGVVDSNSYLQYNNDIVRAIGNTTSPYVVAAAKIKNGRKAECNRYKVQSLFKVYDYDVDLDVIADAIVKEHIAVKARYPLLESLGYGASMSAIAEYINLIDEKKGI